MPVEGVGVVLSRRAEIDEAFRHPEVFSSNMSAVDLGNIRPLIPLQIDPPEHKKYRKILDPIFAPKQMALLEEPVAKLVNDLIDGFVDRGELDFAADFSVPFPSLVFLTLLGLPLDELPRFLAMKDGIIRPDRVTGSEWNSPEMVAHQRATAASIYEYFDGVLDEREGERRDDILSRFLDSEVDGPSPHAGRDPRHLLPVPHRRPRHRDRHARLHVLLPGPAPRAAAADRRRPVDHPGGGRGAAALGDAGDGRGPGRRRATPSSAGARCTRATR